MRTFAQHYRISIAKLKKYKSPGSDQIPAELYQEVKH
jgi:hypothetical protein